jgi:flagellar basal body rod protein FlgG
VAITGPGFFAVTTPNGERYTRQGQFHLDATGTLVTAAGYAVQGDGGKEMSLPPGQVEIDAAGRVSVDGAQRAALRVVRFADAEAVIPEGGALFAAEAEAQVIEVDPAETQLIQGSIENANVDVIKGLLELINVSRGYEAYMRAMQQVDGSIQVAIQQVGAKG